MHTLKNKFIFYSTITLFILFSLFTFFLLQKERNNRINRLESNINRTTELLALTNTNPLWNLNEKDLKKNCNSFFNNEEIIQISITDISGEKYVDLQRKNKGGKIISRQEPINYKGEKIGTIAVKYTTYYLEQELKNIRNKLIILAISAYLAVITIIFLISNKVTTPISKLANNLDNFELDQPHQITNGINPDIKEVNTLISSYQELASELSGAFQELQAKNEELENSYNKMNKLANNLQKIIEIFSSLTNPVFFKNSNQFFSQLLNIAYDLIPEADYGSIYLLEENKVNFIETIGHNKEKLNSLPIKKEHLAKPDKVTVINDISTLSEQKMSEELFTKFSTASKPIKSTLIIKLKVGDQWQGSLNLDIKKESNQEFSEEAVQTIKAFGNIASAFLTTKSYNEVQSKLQKEIIVSVIKILEFHDKYTKGHSEGVAEIAMEIGQKLNMESEKIEQIYWAGMVHDIGKILIDEKILNKPGPLTDEEFAEIKKHPIWGHEVLKTSSSPKLKNMAHYIRHHHERWDGGGYPDGLQGEEIPLISRILCIADSWNAMRTDRAYRDKLPVKTALQELKENKGTQFDPEITEFALDLLEKDKGLGT